MEAESDFKRVTTRVDRDDEISRIMRKVHIQDGPAIPFENVMSHTLNSRGGYNYSNTFLWPEQSLKE